MRKFEKISFEQFKKDIKDDVELYNSYRLPTRKTMHSAGYDMESLVDIHVSKGATIKIPLGIKATMNDEEMLLLVIRSSMATKHNIKLVNQVGVVDRDYYNNSSNEGHIFLFIQNEGAEDFVISKGDCFCQGIFTPFLKVDEEEETKTTRQGGFGSTSQGGTKNE